MATISYHVKGIKNPSPIYMRFSEGKDLDIWEKTGLYVNPIYWDKPRQQIKKVLDVRNRDEINGDLKKLSVFIIDEFNEAYRTQELINKYWAAAAIKNFFGRPKQEEKLINQARNVYLSDYAQHWIDNKAKTHKVSSSKFMDERTIMAYQQIVNNIVAFEGKNKIQLKNINSDVLDSFSLFLTQSEGYASNTVKRKIMRLKFFCERAERDGLEVNRNFKSTIFVEKEKVKYKQPYFNESEIGKIYKHDFSYDKTLDKVRDNLIIGLWTGLRVSDFLTRLDISNITNDFIEITPDKTQDYGINVSIPIHWMIKEILHKRNGQLPPKISEQKFNDYIKIIGQIVEIDEEMIGGITEVDKKTKKKRKVVGVYKKYLLITSHICRRSFATNLFGKVPNKVIMDVAGWRSERQMFEYNKQTNRESATLLKEHWEKQK